MHPTFIGIKLFPARGTMPKRLAVLLLLTTSPLVAQTRFDGTWLMKMDTLQFSGTPEEYLVDQARYRCLSCVPPVDVKSDGSDQKVSGHDAYYDTMSARILDEKSVEFTFKKNGKVVARSSETVSPDGKPCSKSLLIRAHQTKSRARQNSFGSVTLRPVLIPSQASGKCGPLRMRRKLGP